MAKTRGNEIVEVCGVALEALRQLSFQSYARHDISEILEPLSSQVELFLRSVVFPLSTRSDDFYSLIRRLRSVGLSPTDVSRLQSLRKLNNKSKHEPNADLVLKESIDTVQDARTALVEISRLNVGATGTSLERQVRYHLWVGFWDHYTSGDTEIAIMLPGEHWTHVAAVDTMHMHASDWGALKSLLISSPRFHLGEEHFQPDVWQSFCSEGDFLNAGVWDGEYRELVHLLSVSEYSEIADQLLPGLSRPDNPISVGTSAVMAAIDVVRALNGPVEQSKLVADVLMRADKEYAMPSDSAHIKAAVDQVCTLISQLAFNEWKWLSGPMLVLRRDRPESEKSTISGPLDIVLDDGAILIRFDDSITVTVSTSAP